MAIIKKIYDIFGQQILPKTRDTAVYRHDNTTVSDLSKEFTITLTTTWVGSGPFTQNVTVSGLREVDVPILSVVHSTNINTAISQENEWGKIVSATSSANTITFNAISKTTTNLTILVKLVRA